MRKSTKEDYNKYWRIWRETLQFETDEELASEPIRLTAAEKEAAGPILPYNYETDEDILRI